MNGFLKNNGCDAALYFTIKTFIIFEMKSSITSFHNNFEVWPNIPIYSSFGFDMPLSKLTIPSALYGARLSPVHDNQYYTISYILVM